MRATQSGGSTGILYSVYSGISMLSVEQLARLGGEGGEERGGGSSLRFNSGKMCLCVSIPACLPACVLACRYFFVVSWSPGVVQAGCLVLAEPCCMSAAISLPPFSLALPIVCCRSVTWRRTIAVGANARPSSSFGLRPENTCQCRVLCPATARRYSVPPRHRRRAFSKFDALMSCFTERRGAK